MADGRDAAPPNVSGEVLDQDNGVHSSDSDENMDDAPELHITAALTRQEREVELLKQLKDLQEKVKALQKENDDLKAIIKKLLQIKSKKNRIRVSSIYELALL
jgi:uncharacterized protein YlxW (UPF0749 family)